MAQISQSNEALESPFTLSASSQNFVCLEQVKTLYIVSLIFAVWDGLHLIFLTTLDVIIEPKNTKS